MLPVAKVLGLISKHSQLEKELSSEIVNKISFAEKSREYSNLNEIIQEAKEYAEFEKNKSELENIVNDKSADQEMRVLAEAELEELKEKNISNEKKIKIFLLPKD